MTREEKQKAIDALKISAPVMVMTQEEFNDYIQTLNKIMEIMDRLEQEPKFMAKSDGTIERIKSEWEYDHEILKAYSDGANEVLDKLRAEIEQTSSRYSISRERGGMGQVEWSDRLIKESEVLKILDKYKSESEGEK